jgi:hypothetical protein
MATSATELLMNQLRMQQAFDRSTRSQTDGFSQALSYSSAIGRSYEAAATNLVRGVAATGARDIGAVRDAMEKIAGYAEKTPVTHRKGIQELQSVLKTKEAQLLRNNEAVGEMNLLKSKLDTLHSDPGHKESEVSELLSAMKNNVITKSKETDLHTQNEIKAIHKDSSDREAAYHKYMSVDADPEKEGFQAPKFGQNSDSEQAYYKDLRSGYETADRTGGYTQFLSLFDTPNLDVTRAKTADVNIGRAKRSDELAEIREDRSVRTEDRVIENNRLTRKANAEASMARILKAEGNQKSLQLTDYLTQVDSLFNNAKRGMARFMNEMQGDTDRGLYTSMPVLSDNYMTTSQGRIGTFDAAGAIRSVDLSLMRLMEETASEDKDKVKSEWLLDARNMHIDPTDPERRRMMDDFIARNSDEFGPIPEGSIGIMWDSPESNNARTKRYSIMSLLEARTMIYALIDKGVLQGEDMNDNTNDSETNKDGGFSISKGIKKRQ